MDHLNLNNVLIDNQHGFQSNYSCVTQLIAFIEDVSYALDHQKQVDIILLDFSAFDTVPHQRLLSKLKLLVRLTTGSKHGLPSVHNTLSWMVNVQI